VLTLAASVMATSAEAAVRNGPEAVTLAERARELSEGKDAAVLDTLGAAYAESGKFDRALEAEDAALALAQGQGDAGLLARLRAHRAKFEGYQALRDGVDEGTL